MIPSLWRCAGGEGPGTQVSEQESGGAAVPGSHISQTCHIPPCLSPICTDVRSSHRLPLGNKTQTGNQGLLWCCWWSWV